MYYTIERCDPEKFTEAFRVIEEEFSGWTRVKNSAGAIIGYGSIGARNINFHNLSVVIQSDPITERKPNEDEDILQLVRRLTDTIGGLARSIDGKFIYP